MNLLLIFYIYSLVCFSYCSTLNYSYYLIYISSLSICVYLCIFRLLSFIFSACIFSLFCFHCFIIQLAPCFIIFFFPVYCSVRFAFNWLITFLVSFVHWVNLLYFLLLFFGLFWFSSWVYKHVSIFHYFRNYLPDF